MTPMPLHYKLGALVTGIFLAYQLRHYFTPAPMPPGSTVIATPAPELKRVPKVDITPPKVAVFAPAAKKKVGLPTATQADPNKHVLGSSKVKSDTHPHTITTVIDSTTGEVTTFDRMDKLPWLAAESRGEVRIGTGFNQDMSRVHWLRGQYDVLQVKALHAGVDGSIYSDGQKYVGLSVAWKW